VRNVGKAVTRDEIRNALWKTSDLYTGSRTIDVHVQHLRAKVEDNPSDPKLILTVQGTGYMLDAQIKPQSNKLDTQQDARPF
jgi:DNA-binding response OmpR family regulator